MEVKKELKKRNLVSPFFQILTQILNLLKEGAQGGARQSTNPTMLGNSIEKIGKFQPTLDFGEW